MKQNNEIEKLELELMGLIALIQTIKDSSEYATKPRKIEFLEHKMLQLHFRINSVDKLFSKVKDLSVLDFSNQEFTNLKD
jgi:hypothetical protein